MNLLNSILILWLVLGCFSAALPAKRQLLHSSRYLSSAIGLLTLFFTFFCPHFVTQTFTTSLSLTHLSFTLQFDTLSRFFVALLSISTLAVCSFGQTYFQHFTLKQQKLIQSALSFFVLAMLLVLTAGNSFTFLFAWELMALSSYFLVVFNQADKSIRQAGFLYLGIAHLGFLGIASAFFLLGHTPITDGIANTIFILMLIGFGAKAGLFPLHIWLPQAYSAAPSPISALMSGVMLKTTVYGLIRFSFYWLLPYQQTWWGYVLIVIGLCSMLIGVIHAALQTDIKRLLAYSSIENIGFIAVCLGLGIVLYQYHQYRLSDVALLIVLLHSLSHSIFKSLLFLSTGSILHATGERSLGKLGGLIQKMPWVSACTLIACLSMAGLPLFSGFISEWLYLRLFFSQGPLTHFNFAILLSVIVAISVLVFSLAGFVVVKYFGIAFLGQPRESLLVHASPASWAERVSLAWLAMWSVFIGLWPAPFISFFQNLLHGISHKLVLPWPQLFTLSLSKSDTNQDGFMPILLLLVLIVALLLIFLLIKRYAMPAIQRKIPWGCGFNVMTSRMQESSEGFSQPFKIIFAHLIQTTLVLPKASDINPQYHAQIKERIWPLLYDPLRQGFFRIVALTRWIQQGKISAYLTYMALTLFILLIGVMCL